MVNVKPNKTHNQKFKSFEIELKTLGLQDRCKLNDEMIAKSQEDKQPGFSYWVNVLRIGTDLTDEEINKFSSEEIIAIAETIFEEANKKK